MRADVATASRMGVTMSPTRRLHTAKILEISTLIQIATIEQMSMTIWRINCTAMEISPAAIVAIPTLIWRCLGLVPVLHLSGI